MVRIECPACGTSYTAERLGLKLELYKDPLAVTVKCVLCGAGFDVVIEPAVETVERVETPRNWFARVVLRKGPVVTEVVTPPAQSHVVTTATVREE